LPQQKIPKLRRLALIDVDDAAAGVVLEGDERIAVRRTPALDILAIPLPFPLGRALFCLRAAIYTKSCGA
jgi:hypothetical protein